MTKNWDKYYEKRRNFYIKREMKEWEQFQKKNKELTYYVQKQRFIHIKYIDQKELIEKITDFTGESIYSFHGGYNLLKNDFKKWLIDNFSSAFSTYSETPIKYFVEREIPKARERYKKSFDNSEKTFDPEFLVADNETIIDFIAEYNARRKSMDEIEQENQSLNQKRIFKENLEPDIESTNTKKDLTVAQIVLVFGLLNDQNKILKHQDRIRFARFIAELTGRNDKNIKDTVNKYFNDIPNGNIHKTEQRNIDDYERVRSLFEMIDNQDIVKVIDKRIDRLKKQMINR